MSDQNLVHTETYKGYTVKIYQDPDSTDPRENDNLGRMACLHHKYDLGDYTLSSGDFEGWDKVKEYLKNEEHAVVIVPLYLLDHSGVTIRTTSFNDPWDSGQVGYIYVSKEKVLEEYGWKRITKDRREKLVQYLTAEVETYNDYLTSNVYGYVIEDSEGKHVDSCWGYYGDYEKNVLVEARSTVDILSILNE